MRSLLIILLTVVLAVSGVIAPVKAAQARLDQALSAQSEAAMQDEAERHDASGAQPHCDEPCPGCDGKAMDIACQLACLAAAAAVFVEPAALRHPGVAAVNRHAVSAVCPFKALAPPAPPPRLSILI